MRVRKNSGPEIMLLYCKPGNDSVCDIIAKMA